MHKYLFNAPPHHSLVVGSNTYYGGATVSLTSELAVTLCDQLVRLDDDPTPLKSLDTKASDKKDKFTGEFAPGGIVPTRDDEEKDSKQDD